MQVSTTTPAAASIATLAPSGSQPSATLDYSAFLRLLIAQLKNQDPTKPMDSAQYVGQLAAFSNVEQAVKTNAKLDALMSSFALTQAEAFIGRTITSADGGISGTVVSMRVTSDGAVARLNGGQEILLGPGITVA
jgi:flagellar basal-body rod modification protein FlgD